MCLSPVEDIMGFNCKSWIWKGQFWGMENQATDAAYLHGDQWKQGFAVPIATET